MQRFTLALLSLFLAVFFSSARATPAPRRVALLVGISKYPQDGPYPWPTLHTEQDVAEVRKGLLAYGFENDDVWVLRDQKATGPAIRAAFEEHLIRDARPGDVIVFYFAGHGQLLPDDNGDEADGWDESLVPADASDQRAAAGAKTNLRDDEIGAWLSRLTQRMKEGGHLKGNVTVILDSCFAGTATRAGSAKRGRGWDESLDGPPPPRRSVAPAEDPIGLFAEGQAAAQEYVVLAAAQSTQIANEHSGRGVFTEALIRALMDPHTSRQTTYRMLIDRVAGEVMATFPNQIPQAEGAIDQQLFSGLLHPQPQRENAVWAVLQPDGALQLPLGRVHGAVVGSVFGLYPAEAATFDAHTQVATATLTQVEPFVARAQLSDPPASPLPRDLLAIELAHRYDDRALQVQSLGLEAVPAVAEALRRLPLVKLDGANSQDYDVQVRYDPVQQAIELRRAGQESPIDRLKIAPNVEQDLVRDLEGLWRGHFLTFLRNDNPQVQIELRFVPLLPNTTPGTPAKCSWTPRSAMAPAVHLRAHPGDCFQIELVNHSGRPVYVSVLEIDPKGEIAVWMPCKNCGIDNLLHTDTEPFPVHTRLVVSSKPGQHSIWKAIVTSQFVDFRALSFSPVGQRSPTAYVGPQFQPLVNLLRQVWQGQRAAAGPPSAISQQDWGTAEAILEVVPATPTLATTPTQSP
jgi:hypothetical protein